MSPGFIDVHSHSDYTLLVDPRAVSAILQGVTLEIVGNCGHGCAPIGNFQLVASKMADLKVRLETCRLMLYRAGTAQVRGGEDAAVAAAVAKLYIAEAAVQSSLDAIQFHGAYGYTREYEVERDLRDTLGGKLYSGTSEIQRLIIARYLGLAPIA